MGRFDISVSYEFIARAGREVSFQTSFFDFEHADFFVVHDLHSFAFGPCTLGLRTVRARRLVWGHRKEECSGCGSFPVRTNVVYERPCGRG
jgi:hypothetical protein